MSRQPNTAPSPLEPGVPTALAALVIALDESGVISKANYRDALRRLWTELPEDDAFNGEALACQRLFDFLDR